MYLQYGSYQHPQDEALLQSFEVIPRLSRRNRRMETLYRMRVTGERKASGQAAITSSIQELVNAYSDDGQSVALFQDDGTITNHALIQTDPNNVSGVKIVQRSWPRGDPGEYATYRRFAITFEAVFRELESELLEYRERTRIIGNGGASVSVFPVSTGPPRVQQIAERTPVLLIQEGFAVGYDGFPEAYVPGPLYPALVLNPRVRLVRHSPRFKGRKFAEYAVHWSYQMMAPQFIDAVPNIV